MTPRKITASIVILVGPRPFHNELAARLLRMDAGLTCEVLQHDCQRLAGVLRVCAQRQVQQSLILLDVGASGYPLDSRGVFAGPERPRCPVALINMEPESGVEKQAMAAGYRGFFYKTDTLELFVRGVRAVIGGEVWVSRAVLARCLTRKAAPEKADATKNPVLSPREIEVLALVARGAANEDVADMLSVSSNTVKTHLYGIFKKIGVTSRLQAALWAARNL